MTSESQEPMTLAAPAVMDDATSSRLVEITINGSHHKIRPGRHLVAELKKLGHVPIADDLEQIVHGQMQLLADDGAVVIRGQEIFVSHPKSTSSS